MILSTFDDLAQYALRKNSSGVNQINITDSQLTDRIEEALDYFSEFHQEARQKTYISHQITGSHLQLTTNVAASFPKDAVLTGQTSSATMKVFDTPELNKIRSRKLEGTFIVGETITDGTTNAVIAPNGIFVGDIQNKYISLPGEVLSVLKILPAVNGISGGSGAYIFDTQYQVSLKMLSNYANTFMLDYYLLQQNLSMIDMMFGKMENTIPYSRILGKLNFEVDNYEIDNYIVLQVYSSLVADANTKIYNDFWVKKYATALVKKQWAENLGKYKDVILPGGITVNASALWEQATAEIEKLEELMMTTFTEPLGFFVG